jgi:ATP-dependent RNA helicase DeaD
MTDFTNFGLPKPLLVALQALQFSTPTPVQAQAIPPALEGKDVLALAGTGTGKTFAFGLPLIAKLMADRTTHALVLAPTRELAAQVMAALRSVIGPRSPLMSTLLIGGEAMGKQITGLRRNPQLIVGTPGRVHDHLKRGTLDLSSTQILVLDEVDKMLDMGFDVQVKAIADFLPKMRQTMMFSATLPSHIARFANAYLNSPVKVQVASAATAPVKLSQKMLEVTESGKFSALVQALEEREGSVILFIKTKIGADRLAERLNKAGYLAEALHGDLHQSRRSRVTSAFRTNMFRVLVATDVAARGLDVPHVAHVINYHLPQVAEDFLHRIGRTGRAGNEGHALTFVSPEERDQWRVISRMLNPNAAAREKGHPEGDISRDSLAPNARKGNRRTARRNEKRYGNAPKAPGWAPGFVAGEDAVGARANPAPARAKPRGAKPERKAFHNAFKEGSYKEGARKEKTYGGAVKAGARRADGARRGSPSQRRSAAPRG